MHEWITTDEENDIPAHWIRNVTRSYKVYDENGVWTRRWKRKYSSDIDEHVTNYVDNYNN